MSRAKSTANGTTDATATNQTQPRETAAQTRARVEAVVRFLESDTAPQFIVTAIRQVITAAADDARATINFDGPALHLRRDLYRVFRSFLPNFELRATGYANPCEASEPPESERRVRVPSEPPGDDQLSRLRAQLAQLDYDPTNEATRFQLLKQIEQLEREKVCAPEGDEWAGFDIINE